MSNSLPYELRRRVVEAYNQGEGTYQELAVRFRVAFNSVARWVGMDKYCNDFSEKAHGGGTSAIITPEQYPLLKELVAEKPDRTANELAIEWKNRYGSQISRPTMSRMLERAGLSFKKRLCVQ